jgi:hypothetical protein
LPERYDENAYTEDEYEDEYEEDFENDYDDYDIDEDDEFFDELPPEEKKMRKIGRFKMAAGLFNFISVIIGLVVTLIFVSLIITLINWVISDLGSTFKFITK